MIDIEELRLNQLIEEQISYENSFVYEDIPIDEELEFRIDQFENIEKTMEYEDFEDFDEYECYDHYCMQNHEFMELAYVGDEFQEFIPNDDPFDRLDGCDYPEGYNEDLGIVIIEPCCFGIY